MNNFGRNIRSVIFVETAKNSVKFTQNKKNLYLTSGGSRISRGAATSKEIQSTYYLTKTFAENCTKIETI